MKSQAYSFVNKNICILGGCAVVSAIYGVSGNIIMPLMGYMLGFMLPTVFSLLRR